MSNILNANNFYDLIKRPILTEKAYKQQISNRYAFFVDKKANKKSISNAIKKIYSVDVISVNILNKKQLISPTLRGHKKKISGYKKAYVRLKEGQTINVEESK